MKKDVNVNLQKRIGIKTNDAGHLGLFSPTFSIRKERMGGQRRRGKERMGGQRRRGKRGNWWAEEEGKRENEWAEDEGEKRE